MPDECSADDSANLSKSPLLIVVNVASRLAEKLVTTLAVPEDGNLVGHRTGRHKDRRFFAELFGNILLEPIDRRIFAKHIVPDFGRGYRSTHRSGGLGQCIAAIVTRCGFHGMGIVVVGER